MQEEHNSKFIKISFLSLYFYTVPTFTHEGKEDQNIFYPTTFLSFLHFLSSHSSILQTKKTLNLYI